MSPPPQMRLPWIWVLAAVLALCLAAPAAWADDAAGDAMLVCHRGQTLELEPDHCACGSDCLTCDFTIHSAGACFNCTNARFLLNGACLAACPPGVATPVGDGLIGRVCAPSGLTLPTTPPVATTPGATPPPFEAVADVTAPTVVAAAGCAVSLVDAYLADTGAVDSAARHALHRVVGGFVRPPAPGEVETTYALQLELVPVDCEADAPANATCTVGGLCSWCMFCANRGANSRWPARFLPGSGCSLPPWTTRRARWWSPRIPLPPVALSSLRRLWRRRPSRPQATRPRMLPSPRRRRLPPRWPPSLTQRRRAWWPLPRAPCGCSSS